MTKPPITLIGAGSAGTAITLALHRADYPITAIASRSLESSKRCAALVACKIASTNLADACKAAEIIVIGSISRGDVKTIEKHLQAIDTNSSAHSPLYKLLGLEALRLAKAKGKMAQDSAEKIESYYPVILACKDLT